MLNPMKIGMKRYLRMKAKRRDKNLRSVARDKERSSISKEEAKRWHVEHPTSYEKILAFSKALQEAGYEVVRFSDGSRVIGKKLTEEDRVRSRETWDVLEAMDAEVEKIRSEGMEVGDASAYPIYQNTMQEIRRRQKEKVSLSGLAESAISMLRSEAIKVTP